MLDLGYSVDALIDTQLFLDNALDIGFDDRVRVCATSVTNIKIILSTKWIKQYEFVFFNTLIAYQNPRISILCLAPYHQPKNGFLAIEHNTQAQYARILPPHRILTLMPTPHYRFYANAHYFGKHAKQGKHTQNPSFLIVGKISKNLQPTLDVFRQLAHHASFDLFIIGGYMIKATMISPISKTTYTSQATSPTHSFMDTQTRRILFCLYLMLTM